MVSDPSAELAAQCAEDQREHAAVPPAGTPEYRALRERDRQRRQRAGTLLAEMAAGGGASAEDLYHASAAVRHAVRS